MQNNLLLDNEKLIARHSQDRANYESQIHQLEDNLKVQAMQLEQAIGQSDHWRRQYNQIFEEQQYQLAQRSIETRSPPRNNSRNASPSQFYDKVQQLECQIQDLHFRLNKQIEENNYLKQEVIDRLNQDNCGLSKKYNDYSRRVRELAHDLKLITQQLEESYLQQVEIFEPETYAKIIAEILKNIKHQQSHLQKQLNFSPKSLQNQKAEVQLEKVVDTQQ